jgi:hypothetical protein
MNWLDIVIVLLVLISLVALKRGFSRNGRAGRRHRRAAVRLVLRFGGRIPAALRQFARYRQLFGFFLIFAAF